MPETAILLKQWKSLQLKSLPLGFMSAAEQPGFWEASGGSAEFTVVNLINGNLGDKSFFDSAANGMELIKDKYGDTVRVVRKVDEHAAIVQVIQVAAAGILVLSHRLQAVADGVDRDTQGVSQRGGAQRIGHVMACSTPHRNRNFMASADHDTTAVFQLDEFVAIKHERQATITSV